MEAVGSDLGVRERLPRSLDVTLRTISMHSSSIAPEFPPWASRSARNFTQHAPFAPLGRVQQTGARPSPLARRSAPCTQGPQLRDVLLVRAGRSPGSWAREFEPSEQTIRNSVKQTDLDEGLWSDGLTTGRRARRCSA